MLYTVVFFGLNFLVIAAFMNMAVDKEKRKHGLGQLSLCTPACACVLFLMFLLLPPLCRRARYRFAEEEEAADLVEETSVALLPMSCYGSANVLRGPSLYFEWQPAEYAAILAALAPDKCRVELLSADYFGRDMEDDEGEGGEGSGGVGGRGGEEADKEEVAEEEDEEDGGAVAMADDDDVTDGGSAAVSAATATAAVGAAASAAARALAAGTAPSVEPRMGTRYWEAALADLCPGLLAAWAQDAARAEVSAAAQVQASEGSASAGASAGAASAGAGSGAGTAAAAAAAVAAGMVDELALPEPNPFVAGDFSARSSDAASAAAAIAAKADEHAALRGAAVDAKALVQAWSDHQASAMAAAAGNGGGGGGGGGGSGGGGGGGGGGERKKSRIEKGGGSSGGGPSKEATKAVASLPGLPFPRPSETPAPVVPERRLGFASSAATAAGAATGGDGGASGAAAAAAAASVPAAVELWHLLDHRFKLPRVECFLRLSMPASRRGAHGAAANDLTALLLTDAMSERSYLAEMAGLSFSASADDGGGLTLHVHGFSHKAPALLAEAVACLLGLARAGSVLPKRFASAREQLARRYRNAWLKPARHATALRLGLLLPAAYLPAARAAALLGTSASGVSGGGGGGGGGGEGGGGDLGAGRLKAGKVAASKARRPCACHPDRFPAAGAANAFTGGAPFGAWCVVCAPAEAPPAKDASGARVGGSLGGATAAAGNGGGGGGDDNDHEGLTLKAMQGTWLPAFVGAASPGVRATALVCGNASGAEADAVARGVAEALAASGCPALAAGGLPRQPVRRLSRGTAATVVVGSVDAGQKNSACELYWQCGEDSLTTRVSMLPRVVLAPMLTLSKTRTATRSVQVRPWHFSPHEQAP